VAKHLRQPLHILNASASSRNHGPTPPSISAEQAAHNESLLAAQQDAAHADMFWSSLSDIYNCDDVPLAAGLTATLEDELNDYDPIINGSDDERPSANKIPLDKWQEFLDAELEELQGVGTHRLPDNQPDNAANLPQLKGIRAGERACWYPFKNQMVMATVSFIHCFFHSSLQSLRGY
jgi:hypothetical protein